MGDVHEIGAHSGPKTVLALRNPTTSPSGRLHPNAQRRQELRLADTWSDVSFFAAERNRVESRFAATSLKGGYEWGMAAGPSGDFNGFSSRLPHSQSWVANQSWLESLRYYAPPHEQSMVTGSFSGNTHGKTVPFHLECGVRVRAGLCKPDPEYRPEQLPFTWAPEFISPSMARRLDDTLQAIMSDPPKRASSAPPRPPPRPPTSDRLALLAAPRGVRSGTSQTTRSSSTARAGRNPAAAHAAAAERARRRAAGSEPGRLRVGSSGGGGGAHVNAESRYGNTRKARPAAKATSVIASRVAAGTRAMPDAGPNEAAMAATQQARERSEAYNERVKATRHELEQTVMDQIRERS